MLVETTHPDTGETIVLDIPNLTEDQVRDMAHEHASDDQLRRKLENLPLSAEGKAFIARFLKFTLKVGGVAIKLGKKLLEIAIFLTTKLTHLTFWMVLAAVLTFVISLLPLIGPTLAAFLGPLILVGGLGKGIYEQIKTQQPQMVAVLDEATINLRPLAGQAA